jgi:hypothetical protein
MPVDDGPDPVLTGQELQRARERSRPPGSSPPGGPDKPRSGVPELRPEDVVPTLREHDARSTGDPNEP